MTCADCDNRACRYGGCQGRKSVERPKYDPKLAEMVEQLTPEDYDFAVRTLGHDGRLAPRLWHPDLVLAPDGTPYLYRWYLVGGNTTEGAKIEVSPAYVMFHIQVQSDPERPLHDHPWDNQSVIISGSYEEVIQSQPPYGVVERVLRKKGDVITRAASEAHRLILPEGVPYAMTIFTAGPKVRDWGFWYGDEWHHNKQHVAFRDGVSVHVNR